MDAGVTSGFRKPFSAGMHSRQPDMQLFEVVQSADPDHTADFIQWWILTDRRYLVPADRFHHLHPTRSRRPARRMMVGTRTTARDWQWLNDIMTEDAPAAPPTQKNRRMPVSYGCRRGAGRPRRASRGRREGGDAAPTQQTQCGASTSQAIEEAGTSSQAYLSPTPQTQGTTILSTMSSPSQQAFLDGLHSPGFEQLISDIMREGDSGNRPDTQFDALRFIWTSTSQCSVRRIFLWLLVGLLHPHHTCRVPLGTYRLWSMRVCRLLQCHLHRLSSQASQQYQGGLAELHVVEGAAPGAICSSLMNSWQGPTDSTECVGLALPLPPTSDTGDIRTATRKGCIRQQY
ncbi:hypothetical protein PIB30_010412 [Stylosanthes scabra]|uniref:Uncharacterized protein n=1 Tax=Stylosanthes scabra TaxID=79078 RepID=A0ABU6X4B2_9FABA|nr:hypothetical protein [Stylosanthes scabra]